MSRLGSAIIRKLGLTEIKTYGQVNDVRTEEEKKFLARSQDALALLEDIRLTKLKLYEARKKIGMPLAAILTPVCGYADYWLLRLQSGSDDSFAGISFLVLGLLYGWVTSPKRQYRKTYKEKILPEIAKLFGDFTYNISGKIPMTVMQPSKIVPGHDRYRSEDHFSGAYKGVDIEFSEINLQEKRRSKDKTYYVTVFSGLAVVLHTKHKKFYGHTIIERDQNKMGEWFREKSSSLERAKMVDPEFEEIFDAYTNDQVEARYLMDPIMIERLKTLYEEYDGTKMAAAFYDSKMLILVSSTYNHFEPADIYVRAADPAAILNMKREVGEILSIIDKLSLYDPREVERLRQKEEAA